MELQAFTCCLCARQAGVLDDVIDEVFWWGRLTGWDMAEWDTGRLLDCFFLSSFFLSLSSQAWYDFSIFSPLITRANSVPPNCLQLLLTSFPCCALHLPRVRAPNSRSFSAPRPNRCSWSIISPNSSRSILLLFDFSISCACRTRLCKAAILRGLGGTGLELEIGTRFARTVSILLRTVRELIGQIPQTAEDFLILSVV